MKDSICLLTKKDLVEPLKFAAHLATGCDECVEFLRSVFKDYKQTMDIAKDVLESQ